MSDSQSPHPRVGAWALRIAAPPPGTKAPRPGPLRVAPAALAPPPPRARPRPRPGLEDPPRRDPGEQQHAVAGGVRLPALQPVGRVAQLVDRLAQVLLDVLVGGDLRGRLADTVAGGEVPVDLPRGGVRLAQAVPQLLVVERPVDVRPHGVHAVEELVLSLGHGARPFAL